MTSRLSQHLSEARHRRFVGRETERQLFATALAPGSPPFYVLYIYGPGGIGKTTLLGEYSYRCDQMQVPVIALDGRNIEPTPTAFLAALQSALGLSTGDDPFEGIAARPRQILLIDTYETLAPLDGWLRETLLPQLPEGVLTVLAGRQPPSPGWRADLGWQGLVRTVPLRNLTNEESRAYLTQREVPTQDHRDVLEFTHGHPLALSLVADVFAQRGPFSFRPDATPDVVKTLVERLVEQTPGADYRAALEVCALVRVTTETLLAEVLGLPDAHEQFAWLRDLSLVEADSLGLFPHDLARAALMAELRWRNPAWYAELHRRARNYYNNHLDHASGLEQQRVLMDFIFLHRESSMVRPFFEWRESGGVLADTFRPEDTAALVAMVSQHEGDGSARLLQYWLQQQTQQTLVFRDAEGQPAGFMMTVLLHQTTAADRAADPATAAAWQHLQDNGPLRQGEGASLFRFWIARATYQAVSPLQSLIFVNMVRHYRTSAGLAFTFLPCAAPDFWAPMFAYADLQRLREADFTVDGRRYGVYGHDWRTTPPSIWVDLLAEREIALTLPPSSRPAAGDPVVVLSQPEFAGAVRDALRGMARADGLRGSALLRSRMVIDRAGPGSTPSDRAAALESLLAETCATLDAAPKDAKFARVLARAYLHPAPTQEQAAELLDLPFSTYRRHLKTATDRVVDLLWQREISG